MTRFVVWCKRAAILLAVFLAGAQLVRPAHTNPPVTGEVPAANEVRAVLVRACYDCHSNTTTWPWYAHVAPFSWLVAHDVDEGREEVNFSTWDAYPAPKRIKKLREVVETIDEGEMPPWYYVLVHRNAGLTDGEAVALKGWARGAAADAAAGG